jgi:hypothetical protein
MITAAVRSATREDAYMLGIIGPAAYAEAYAYLWDRPGAYSEQLQSFGQRAFETLLTRTDARKVAALPASMVCVIANTENTPQPHPSTRTASLRHGLPRH